MARSFSSSVLQGNADMVSKIESTYREAQRLSAKNREGMKKLIRTMTVEQKALKKVAGPQGVRRGRKSLNECGAAEYVYKLFQKQGMWTFKDLCVNVERNRTTTSINSCGIVSAALRTLREYGVVKNVSHGQWSYCG
jgi:hypothetical protein